MNKLSTLIKQIRCAVIGEARERLGDRRAVLRCGHEVCALALERSRLDGYLPHVGEQTCLTRARAQLHCAHQLAARRQTRVPRHGGHLMRY